MPWQHRPRASCVRFTHRLASRSPWAACWSNSISTRRTGRTRANRESAMQTHEVSNQSTPFVDRNLYATNPALQEAVASNGAASAQAELTQLGARLGSAEVAEWARLANAFPPQLRSFDRYGRRI